MNQLTSRDRLENKLGAIFILRKDIGVGGPENSNFPLLYVGGWVAQKSLKTPLRNIKMAPYCITHFYNIFSGIIFSLFNANSMYPFISLMLLSKRKLEPNLNVPDTQ